jgi:hypothetical protein
MGNFQSIKHPDEVIAPCGNSVINFDNFVNFDFEELIICNSLKRINRN